MKMEEQIELLEKNWPEAIAPHTAVAATIQRLASLINEHARKLLRDHELTFTEFDILATLRALPEGGVLTPSALYDALLMSSGGLTKVLKNLERRSMIIRPTASKDARQRPIALGEKGRDLIDKLMPLMQAMDREILGKAFPSDGACMALAEQLREILRVVETSAHQPE